MEAITPAEARAGKTKVIHPDIIKIVNDLIKQHYKPGTFAIKQEDIVSRFMAANPGYQRQRLFDDGHLDIESTYQLKGWIVTYYKPGYNEFGHSYFKFTETPDWPIILKDG